MSRRMGLDRASVVEAAAKLVDEKGIEHLMLGRLAERLGISTPSLYNHVAGLSGLKHDLALYCLRELRDCITRATVGKSRAEAINALADAYRAYGKKTPGRYALTLQAPSPGDQEVQSVAQQVVEVVLAVLAPYKLGEEDAIHAIRGLRSIVQGFISLEVAGGFGIPIDLDTSFHWLINLYIAGLNRSNVNGEVAGNKN
ncbi:MAG TPA: WHG domain-containing protein [Ktedonobacteraceae bacterium]|nr:WHG domain-containing protein [Ktedonobacteraceae bacterium]